MKARIRPIMLDEVLRKNAPTGKRREFVVHPEGGFFDVKNLDAALRKAAPGDLISVPPGEYPAFELKKPIEIRSQMPGTVLIRGASRISADFALFVGLEFRAAPDQPALFLEKGTLVLDDCNIHGQLNAGSATGKAQLHLRNCTAGDTLEGIVLDHQASAEIISSRISHCHMGLALRGGATGAVYHSRVEKCVGADDADPGVGIFAEQAGIYCEGVTLAENDVGMYLKNHGDSQVLATIFERSETAGLIASQSATGLLHLHSCVLIRQGSSRCAQAALTGGHGAITHCTIKPSPACALTAEESRLDIEDSRLESEGESAMEARSCHITGLRLSCGSSRAAALAAAGCQGTLRHSVLVGHPPAILNDSPQLQLEDCDLRETSPEPSASLPQPAVGTTTIETATEGLRTSVTNESVRTEIAGILRLAHAAQQRKQEGLPVPEQSFHCVFMGPPGTGKLAAAQVLAEGLFAFGVIPSPQVTEVPLHASTESPGGGVVFLRTAEATGSAAAITAAQQTIQGLTSRPDVVVILEGERNTLRRLLRAEHGLDPTFRKTLFFSSFGPLELAAHFALLCENDHIPLSADAARDLLLALHLYCDRKDKRFGHTKGVEFLYDAARRNFLERCSVANRVDLEMETRDFDVPQDKLIRAVTQRCPAFVTFCPSCTKENSWVAGLNRQCVCLHCGASYLAGWGTWKDSPTYRKTLEAMAKSSQTLTPMRRANLPSR